MGNGEEKDKGIDVPGALGSIKTAITWIAEHSSEPKGTATLTSATASWKQEGAHEAEANHTFNALRVRGYHVNDPHVPESEGFNVLVGVQGSFRTDPPEIDGARFVIESAHCGDGTSLDLHFTEYSANALEKNGSWAVPFYCDGTFKIRHDVTINFNGVIYVDTSGGVHLENPSIVPPIAGESQMHPGMSLHWDSNTLWHWEARFETREAMPFVGVAFTFLKETFTTSDTLG